MPPSKTDPILILGGGTWGLSTALHLARRNYTSITVLDSHPIPSAISAGNDINKIAEEGELANLDRSKGNYAMEYCRALGTRGWREDAVFKGFYHSTGLIVAAEREETYEYVVENEISGSLEEWKKLETGGDFRATMTEGVLTGEFPGWRGFYRGFGAGWVAAREAMESCAREAERLGVRFLTGDQGKVTRLLFSPDSSKTEADVDGQETKRDVLGAETADGTRHFASHTILSLGANAPQVLDFEGQLRPTAWTLAHIKLTVEERKIWKDLPVLFNIERGFFMEPDSVNGEVKICDEHPGYCNWEVGGIEQTSASKSTSTLTSSETSEVKTESSHNSTSLPFARHAIPKASETRIRNLLRQTAPQLADRPFSHARICWCADTPDRRYLISSHPSYPSLTLAVGGSGHGFAVIPGIGSVVADCMEGVMDEDVKKAFRWRPETAVDRDWRDRSGRWGVEAGKGDEVMDFGDVGETDWVSGER